MNYDPDKNKDKKSERYRLIRHLLNFPISKPESEEEIEPSTSASGLPGQIIVLPSDPNELVDKLRILNQTRMAGNDSKLINTHIEAIVGFEKKDIKIIPKSIENFISLQIGCLRFLDSYRFLGSSLDSLAKSLNDFPIMRQQQFDDPLLINKLAYPYEYFNPTNFDSKLHLKRKDFWSTLKQNYPKQNEIDRTFEIIKKYNLKSGRELTLMYNLLDVLLLADIFENFIKKCLEYYKINPLYSYSAPGFTWKAFFKFSNTRIDYIKDHKLLLVLENNIRGGISGVMGDRYVKSDDSTKILYIDANNLYGYAMSQFLPIGKFSGNRNKR